MKTTGPGSTTAKTPATKPQSAPMALKAFLESKRASFEDLLPSKKAADRFMRILISLPIMSPAILGCSHASIIEAAILCARDGLEPDGRHAALVPFRNTKANTYEATYEPMVHGYIRQAMETEAFKVVSGREVYENDEWRPIVYSPEPVIHHIPAETNAGELIGCYGYYVLKTGGIDAVYFSVEDGHEWAKEHAPNAVKAQDSLYHRDYRAWLLKTVIRRVLHFAPVSMSIKRDMDDYGMRNVTPGAPVFDVGATKDRAEDLPPAGTVSPADEAGASAAGDAASAAPERQPGEES